MISIGHNINNPYAQYGLDHFLFKYGIKARINQVENPDIRISYGGPINGNEGVAIQILPGEIETGITGYLKIDSERIPLFEHPKRLDTDDNGVLATFQSGSNSYITAIADDKNLLIGFDIFNEIGCALAGHLESIFDKRSGDGKALMKTPIVDILEEFFFRSLQHVCQKNGIELEAKPFWPRGKKFTLCLTHDVDRVYKTYQYIPSILKYLRKGNFSGIARQIKSMLFQHAKSNPYWAFDRVINLENKLGVKSTFYFLNETGELNPFSLKSWILFAGRYKIDSPDIVEIIRKLYSDGFEIGVHGSYYSSKDANLLQKEKRRLEEIISDSVYGIRQHYLNFDQTTPELQESVGFEYDTTVGFSKGIGFRRGTSFPYYPLDFSSNRELSILEIPLIIADSALPNSGAILDQCIDIMDTVARHQGVLTLLFHQRVLNEKEFPDMPVLYKRLVEKGLGENAWVTNAHGLYKWLAYEREDVYHTA